MTKQQDEGHIEIMFPYAMYRKLHTLGKAAQKSPEELIVAAVQVYLNLRGEPD
jgi:hypothetical protein